MSNNEIIIKPIVCGSIALFLGKKNDEVISHKWCVYVRGANSNEDISAFIKEVTFTLHDSFHNRVRTVSKPPFEVYEVGWGEFDIKIQIHLLDEGIKPLEIIHPLKLYPAQANLAPSTKKPVVSENYDEIIFVNPKKGLRAALLKSQGQGQGEMEIEGEEYDNRKDDGVSGVGLDKDTVNNEESKIDNGEGNGNANDQTILDNDKESLSNVGGSGGMIGNSSHMGNTITNTTSNANANSPNPLSYIPNIKNYFQKVDDSAHLKQLDENNHFVNIEIESLKAALADKEKEIDEIKKKIREIK